jgi:hypothetical protein
VCEEAHRYISSDPKLGFLPTRQAISRIAKEGRKYGVSLGIVTQRPGELDPTILSQCSTVFAMRLANDRDQEIIRSALPNSSTSTTSFLASIGNGEAIAFGEAVAVPMRMMFERVPNYALPSANGIKSTASSLNLRSIVEKMRSTESGKKQAGASEVFDIPSSLTASVSSKSDAPLRSAMLANEKQDVPKEERKFSTIMKKESTVRRKPITPDTGDSRSAEDLEREMEEMRNKLLGK